MIVTEVVVPVVLIAGGCLVAMQVKRRFTPDEKLYDLTRPDLVQRLLPYVGVPEESRYIDNGALASAIAAAGGIVVIYRAMGAIGTLAARRARAVDENIPEAELLVLSAWYGRLIALAAMFEAQLSKPLPMLPRVFAGALVKMYVEMAAGIEAVESMHGYA